MKAGSQSVCPTASKQTNKKVKMNKWSDQGQLQETRLGFCVPPWSLSSMAACFPSPTAMQACGCGKTEGISIGQVKTVSSRQTAEVWGLKSQLWHLLTGSLWGNSLYLCFLICKCRNDNASCLLKGLNGKHAQHSAQHVVSAQ